MTTSPFLFQAVLANSYTRVLVSCAVYGIVKDYWMLLAVCIWSVSRQSSLLMKTELPGRTAY